MKIKELKGYENMYPEKFENTSEWFYCRAPWEIDADELLYSDKDYEGNRLYLIHISGKIFEPIRQKKNVFLSSPVYNRDDNAFVIIRYDFVKKTIQIVKYEINSDNCSVIGEVPLSKGGDLINIKILQNSYILVKYENTEDTANIIYPDEKCIHLEENEGLISLSGNMLVSSKWIEDPDYREEIIIRDYETTEITERKDGYAAVMPNGEIWMFCK